MCMTSLEKTYERLSFKNVYIWLNWSPADILPSSNQPVFLNFISNDFSIDLLLKTDETKHLGKRGILLVILGPTMNLSFSQNNCLLDMPFIKELSNRHAAA